MGPTFPSPGGVGLEIAGQGALDAGLENVTIRGVRPSKTLNERVVDNVPLPNAVITVACSKYNAGAAGYIRGKEAPLQHQLNRTMCPAGGAAPDVGHGGIESPGRSNEILVLIQDILFCKPRLG